jgi:murein DD-endopeptidase MepM/ murein hydrolase activator NlpD
MRKKKSPILMIFTIFLAMILGAGGYLYNSDMFEQQQPDIKSPDLIYWNLKKNISVDLSDNVGIKHITAFVSDGENSIPLINKLLAKATKDYKLLVDFPRSGFFTKKSRLKLIITVTDNSKWNYFAGNKSTKEIDIILDNKKPKLQMLDASYGIRKGGSALVTFEAKDPNLKSVYIQTNYGKTFNPTPFYKDGYYISLVAWPVDQKTFSAKIIAEDLAGNKSQANLRYYLKNKTYKKSNITLKDSFIQGKITELIEEEGKDSDQINLIERFKYVNEDLRGKNEKLIEDITSKTDQTLISDFYIEPFNPLKNGAAVASFGDHRKFFKDDKMVSESLHLGLDLASIKNANITSSNKAKVVHNEYNGIYGLNLILYHGLGLYSLYGHCDSIKHNIGDIVEKGDVVATSGMTGLALGDHLHFGMLVQGIEVRPEEWLDQKWLELNVFDIIKNSKKIINTKSKI